MLKLTKLNHIIKKLDIKKNQIFDIGCGWGGLGFEIAKQKIVRLLEYL